MSVFKLHFTIDDFAKELKVHPSALWESFLKAGLIEWQNGRYTLTELGMLNGGDMFKNTETVINIIVWPQSFINKMDCSNYFNESIQSTNRHLGETTYINFINLITGC